MKKLNYLLAMLASCVICGCEESSKDATLSIDNTQLIFDADGSSSTLLVSSDADWSIMHVPDWLEFSTMSGTLTQSVTVTAKANQTGVLREGQFLVRTNNGSQQQIVNVRQFGDGDDLSFTVKDVTKRWLNGDNASARGMDSIYVDANIPWCIEASEWIAASFQGKPVEINGKVQYTGSGYIIFVPKSRNEELEDRTGFVRIRSPYSQSIYEIPVAQLGVGHVVPIDPLLLANGYATQLKVGAGVNAIRAKFFEGHAKDSEVTYEAANEGWYLADYHDDAVIYDSSLKPNTQYELCVWTISSNNNYWKDGLNRFTFTTPSDQNQPLCTCYASYDSGVLTCYYLMNSIAKGYYSFTFRNVGHDELFVAHTMRDMIRQGKRELKKISGIYKLNNITTDVTLYTWAVNADQQLSTVITTWEFKMNNRANNAKKSAGVGMNYANEIKDNISIIGHHE